MGIEWINSTELVINMSKTKKKVITKPVYIRTMHKVKGLLTVSDKLIGKRKIILDTATSGVLSDGRMVSLVKGDWIYRPG